MSRFVEDAGLVVLGARWPCRCAHSLPPPTLTCFTIYPDGPRRGSEPDRPPRPHHPPALGGQQPVAAVVQRGWHGAPEPAGWLGVGVGVRLPPASWLLASCLGMGMGRAAVGWLCANSRRFQQQPCTAEVWLGVQIRPLLLAVLLAAALDALAAWLPHWLRCRRRRCLRRIGPAPSSTHPPTHLPCAYPHQVRRWDVETGKVLAEAQLHEKQVMDMQMSVDGTHFITASADRTAKLVDTQVCVCGGGGMGGWGPAGSRPHNDRSAFAPPTVIYCQTLELLKKVCSANQPPLSINQPPLSTPLYTVLYCTARPLRCSRSTSLRRPSTPLRCRRSSTTCSSAAARTRRR